jgi:membrane dipeptidase
VRIDWRDLGTQGVDRLHGADVAVDGFAVPLGPADNAVRFLLVGEMPCCPGCAPRDPNGAIAVTAERPLPMRSGMLRLTGRWLVAATVGNGPRYQLHEARTSEPPGWRNATRRGVLAAAGSLICMGVSERAHHAAAADAVTVGATVDLHSHAGGIANVSRIRMGTGFGIVADPMRRGGMAAICLAVVSDGPTHHVTTDGRIHPFRDPAPGELYDYGQLAFRRVTEFARAEGLAPIADAASLQAAQAGRPSFIMAAEGADFLEGDVDRVDEALARWQLRHLQLTHYRVNELGDIQTEAPVHGGLTDTGAAVIRRCNQLGIVVDVAHGTLDLVKRAAAVTEKPLVLSHTSLTTQPRPFTRRITPEHARIVADTGGVIGVWPPASVFPDLNAMATGIARMVDATGIDHVGLGSDMRGLTGPSALPDYDRLPDLAQALLSVGFGGPDVTKLLGGNYIRVFTACLA